MAVTGEMQDSAPPSVKSTSSTDAWAPPATNIAAGGSIVWDSISIQYWAFDFGYTDIFCYSDSPLTVIVLVNPMLPKSVTVSKYLLTVTLFPCPEGVTVTKEVCFPKTFYQIMLHRDGQNGGPVLLSNSQAGLGWKFPQPKACLKSHLCGT